ncbi:hypothetical protein JAO76_01615 [Pontibacter sp. BT310]|uniref:DUF5636 domain-containing protein n=1 Tax=Pontibacter populi TaxID=890055 RepID=A0ABS6X760_9BACT|nr:MULTISPECIES: hypothetical protein [Pontibacter]MBJ6116869.1 hypothetical protein [Pontibacter sp. BT310]MBR0569291.1 hypothetical protein [Microvirga sp. STS03]MBW3363722.1 hypothetical protein [Pontibacter populi]
MKEKEEENVVALYAGEQQPDVQEWQKSIPAQVFLNYFFAINYHIKNTAGNGLDQLSFFKEAKPELTEKDTEAIKRLLLNSWSTEYALRATAELGDEAYMRNALHWTFPQAYYTVFAGLQAFMRTCGINTNSDALVLREAGRLVVKNAYPHAISFYASGHFDDFNVHRLPLAHYKPGLQIAGKELEAQAQIGQFLRTTRRMKAKAVRQFVQGNTNTAIRSGKTGEILQKFGPQHWQQLTWRIGYTTLFDLMARLRISSSHREIERFVQAEIDFKLFHESLLEIVSYLNGIHEAYIAQALGIEQYEAFVKELPKHLQESFVAARLQQTINPLLRPDEDYQLGAAA